MSDRTITVQAKVCDGSHGGPGNAATIYGHFNSSRTCLRVGMSEVWVYGLNTDQAPRSVMDRWTVTVTFDSGRVEKGVARSLNELLAVVKHIRNQFPGDGDILRIEAS